MKKICLLLSLLVLAACTKESAKQFVPPTKTDEKVEDTSNIENFEPIVDILFVVDNSGSMQYHQNNLITNLAYFTQEFTKKSFMDYHIGVVTTDMTGGTWGGSGTYAGKLVGSVRVVDRLTPAGNAVLSANLRVGTNGSGSEESFSPVIAAITPPLSNGWNTGFYRPDAKLAIIFITDATDQSNLSENTFLSQLLALKKNDINQILAYGVLPASFDPGCYTEEQRPANIERFLALVKKGGPNVMSLCSPTYGQELAKLGEDLAKNVGSMIYLSRLPDPTSLRVTLGPLELPKDPIKGWSYDPNLNAIALGEDIDWKAAPQGSTIKVHFNAAKAKQ